MLTLSRTRALLHEDHMSTIETLQALEEWIGRHRTAPAADATVVDFLSRVERTLREEVEKHFGFEENHLFPVFVGLGETGIVTMLTHEHRSILPLAVRVAELAAAALDSGFDDRTWRDFADNGQELVEREIFHIQKEEMGLLAAISSLVDADTDARLAEVYKHVVG